MEAVAWRIQTLLGNVLMTTMNVVVIKGQWRAAIIYEGEVIHVPVPRGMSQQRFMKRLADFAAFIAAVSPWEPAGENQ
jgi:hypothetical protein